MGEAYRGLTIKIGADTSKLQRSMNQLQGAMRAIAADGRKLKSALATNPGSIDLAKSNMRQLSEVTRGTAEQVAYLRKSLDQAGMSGKSAAQLIQRFGSSEMKLANMRNSFNDLNAELEITWDKLRRFLAGTSDVDSKEWKEAAEYVSQLKSQLTKAENKLRDLKAEGKENSEAWETWSRKVDEVKNGIRAAFAELGGRLPYGAENIEQVISAFDRLRIAQKRQQQSLEAANKSVGIKNAAVDMQVFEEKVRAANAQLTEMVGKQQRLGNGEAREAAAEMERYTQAAREAKSVVASMDEALRMNPSSIEAATVKYGALKDQIKMVGNAINAAEKRQKSLSGADVAGMREKYGTLANAVRMTGDAFTEASTKADMLHGQLRQAITDAKMLREQMMTGKATGAQYEEALANVKQLRSEYVSLRAAAKSAREEFERANDAHALEDMRHQVAALRAEYKGLNASMHDSSARLMTIGQSIRTMGYGLYSTITPAIMMTGMYMIQAADDIDAAYRDMRKTVNGTEEDFVHLKEAAIEYSRSHVTSAKDMLEIEAIGGQLGITVENLEKFGQVVSNLDIATNLDTETISANLGQLSAIMKDMDQSLQSGPGSMEAFSDALVRLGNNSATQEDKIMSVMMRIASMGTISGMATPDLLALSTAVAATGQGSEAAGTAISKTFSNIEGAVAGGEEALRKFGPVAEMNGEELAEYQEAIEGSAGKLEKFAQVSGMTAQQFADSWKNTPTEAFTAFIQGLKNIDEAGGSVDQTLKELGINSVRQKQTLMGLTNTIGNMNDYLTMSGDAWNGVADQWGQAGDAAYEAQQKSQGFSGQLEILKNNAKALAEEAAQGLVGPMQVLTGLFQGLTAAVQGMPDILKTVAVSFAAIVGAAGPLSVMIGATLDGMAKISAFKNKGRDAWNIVAKGSASSAEGMMLMATAANTSGGALERLGTKVFDLGGKMTSSGGKLAKFGGMLESIGLGMVSLRGPQIAAAVAGVIALGAAVGVLAGEYDRWKTRQDNLVKSTSGMLMATQSTIAMMESGRSKVREYGQAQIEASKSLDDFAASQAAHTDAVNQIKNSYEEQLVTLNSAQRYLELYAGKSNLSAQEQGKLKAAIDWVNSACGTQYSVIDAANGVISDSSGNYDAAKSAAGDYKQAILDLIEAKKAEAKVEAYSDMLKEQTKAQAEQTKQLASARSERAQALKDLGDLERSGVTGGQQWEEYAQKVSEANMKVADANNALDATSKSIEETETAMGNAIVTVNETSSSWRSLEATVSGGMLTDYMSAINKDFGSFRQNAQDAGIAAETFSNLSRDQIMQLADAYTGNTDSIVNALNSMGIELQHVSEIQIGDKTYQVNDDGSIAWQEGQVEDLRAMQIGNKRYYVTDDGTVYNSIGQVQNLDSLNIDPKMWYTDDNGTTKLKESEVDQLDRRKIEDKSFTVTAHDNASGKLSFIQSLINSIHDKTVTLTTNYVQNGTKTATGGMLPHARIAAHAAGGYFVDRPTVIGHTGNVAHIAGEAGREYVSTHANGGVVLPLTNPYMKPWVNAVANQMSGSMGGTYNITIIGAPTESPEQFARKFTRAVARQQRTGR